MSNLTENRLDTVLSAADLTEINNALALVAAKLPVISLTDKQRKSMHTIDVSNKVFAEDAITRSGCTGRASSRIIFPWTKCRLPSRYMSRPTPSTLC